MCLWIILYLSGWDRVEIHADSDSRGAQVREEQGGGGLSLGEETEERNGTWPYLVPGDLLVCRDNLYPFSVLICGQ